MHICDYMCMHICDYMCIYKHNKPLYICLSIWSQDIYLKAAGRKTRNASARPCS